MKYLSGIYTDVGIKKKTNQDSMLLMHADTEYGEAVFAVICDGMGGLQKGEVASAEVIHACADWFRTGFPMAVNGGTLDTARIQQDWLQLMRQQDRRIADYGSRNGFNLGTTLVCMLIYNNYYYVANIGDSRAYLLSDQIYQITHDHTVVQREIDRGMLTVEQAINDSRRSVLLQCIGASDYVEPDFFAGEVHADQCFLLCCDGFRHVISPQEIYQALGPHTAVNERVINAQLQMLTETVKARGETDNISAILIRSYYDGTECAHG